MEAFDYWRLSDEFSIVQTALLILQIDPSECQQYIQNWEAEKKPRGYEALVNSLTTAVSSKLLPAKIKTYNFSDRLDNIGLNKIKIKEDELNPFLTTVHRNDVQKWLLDRGITSGFFFSNKIDLPNYLDALNPNYAPKLAAAVNGWIAIATNPDLQRGKTPKQALDTWLRRNADQFGLTKEDGNPNETAIEEISKIANWKPEGGVAKTPGATNLPTPKQTIIK